MVRRLPNSLRFCWLPFAAIASIAIVCCQLLIAAETAPIKLEFNRDVRPILSDKCFVCHGPDSAKRAAGLRLDQRDAATAERDGARAIVPHNSTNSEVYRRISSTDPDEQMPPPASSLKLSAAEIDLLKQWIDQGAEYQPHWSFIPPKGIVPPTTHQSAGSRNPIDSFVRDGLDREGFHAATDAEKSTLIRRVSFDLIGLPPTLAEIDEFISDLSPDAFERLVDRLLASPRYGERMAANWLDAARYADTNGYQTDGPRFMWRWRDWVIDAFNQNLTFDEFTIDQLAGDIIGARADRTTTDSNGTTSPLPWRNPFRDPATANARMIATGFNRNHRGNAEGGIIPEEFRIEYVVDRVETTSTVWLGLTIGCARCHDHKYDPINQREFYQLFAFFNQVPEPGKYIRNGNSMPYLPAPTADQQRHLENLKQESIAAHSIWLFMQPAVRAGMDSLAANIREKGEPLDWSFREGLESHIAFDGNNLVERPVVPLKSAQDQKVESHKPANRGQEERLSCVWRGGEPDFSNGRIGQAANLDGREWIEAPEIADFGDDESFAISCWVKPKGAGAMTILAKMDHDNASRGYEWRREANGRLQVLFSGRILDDLIRVETDEVLSADQWSHIFVSYDGSSAARGVSVRINGAEAKLTVLIDLLSNPIKVKPPLCVGGGGSAKPFVGQIDELRCYRGQLTVQAALSLSEGDSISEIAARPLETRQRQAAIEKLNEFYLAEHAPENQRQARRNSYEARSHYLAYLATVPTTMVMADQANPRETHILKRGEYDKPGDLVETAFPTSLSQRPINVTDTNGSSRLDRLDLARWLVSPENPLTARVTVNRLWQSLFGVGLVKTAEDFGTQGEAPTHPELLDWLAVEFQGRKQQRTRVEDDSREQNPIFDDFNPQNNPAAWNLQHILRQMVTSATYRQSSYVSDELRQRDPDNRWLARGPRFRLPAEMIRDAALATSGLLVEKLGGPSVKPYQPAGLWEELSADAVPGPFSIYVQDHGANLYRRGVYTYRRRTAPPPALAIFDSSPREACRVSLPRTNTPLQALNLMNDVAYIEAARVLAERAIKEGGASAPSRLEWAVRRILSRNPSDRELNVLIEGYERRRKSYLEHPQQVEQFLALGETPRDQSIDPTELAAYAATMSVIFNVDEAIVKP